jgi:2-haloacid dehalogenase
MKVMRRDFIQMLSAAAIARWQSAESWAMEPQSHIKAVALDTFVVFDPGPIARRVEEIFPGRGAEFLTLWRSRQFEYTWLRTISNRYKGFLQITEDALKFTASNMNLALSPAQRRQLLEMYLALPPWPDAAETLATLRQRGVRIAFLANFSAAMLDANVAAAKLKDYFEPHLTTDHVQAFKPSPLAYQMGPGAFRLEPREIAYVPSAAWDAAGAKWFGYPTIWVNRANAVPEDLDAQPDVTVPNFHAVLEYLKKQP